MPMYKAATPTSPARLIKAPSSPRMRRASGGVEEDLWTAYPTTPPKRSSVPTTPSSSAHSRTSSKDGSSRLKRRLHRWVRPRELDFGCAGDWSEGPANLGDAYYSRHPGGSNRHSTASSSGEPAWTHSRGPSTSSNYSVSTAASSVPTSPVIGSEQKLLPAAPISPYTSHVPLTPRTAHRRRQSDEAAAVDAVNTYFHRVRLSQIAEDDGARASRRTSAGGATRAGTPAAHTRDPSTTGLAIFGASSEELSFDLNGFEPSSQPKAAADRLAPALHHTRSISHDLEIEFIETGHTTYTPLSVHLDNHCPSSTFILPEDAFICPAPSPAPTRVLPDTPSAASTFTAESAESCETAATSSTAKFTLHRRSPIAAHDIGPALDELSEYFSASVPELSSGSSTTSSSSEGHYTDAASARPYFAATLAPPAHISPGRKHLTGYSLDSPPTSPRTQRIPLVDRQLRRPVVAVRGERPAPARASSTPSQQRALYDWI